VDALLAFVLTLQPQALIAWQGVRSAGACVWTSAPARAFRTGAISGMRCSLHRCPRPH
jgi:hypothetical protein